MLQLLARNWWLVVLRGVLAIIFGVMALVWPLPTLEALVILFGAYVLVDGIFELISAISGREEEQWWLGLLEGVLGIAAGILTFLWPNVTGLVLLYFIAAWAILTGVLAIFSAIRLRREIEGEWFLGLSGLLSVIFGVLLFFFPTGGAVAVIWLIGSYAILFGVLLVILGLRLRGWRRPQRMPSRV